MITASKEMNIKDDPLVDLIKKDQPGFIDFIKNNDLNTICLDKNLQIDYLPIVYKTIFEEDSDFLHLLEEKLPYKFKDKNKFDFYYKLLKVFEVADSFISNDNYTIFEKLLTSIVKIDKGQVLLKLINLKKIFDLEYFKGLGLFDIYFSSGVNGTLPVFLEIEKFVELKTYNKNNKDILTAACRNADIRVLKYIVENFNTYHNSTLNSKEYIKVLFCQIFSFHIPTKYSLRRLKIISSKIDFIPHFNIMIDFVSDIDTFLTLDKYYNSEKKYVLEERNINNLVNSVLGAYNNESMQLTTYPFEIKENVIKLINCFSSNKDKFKFLMHLFIVTKTFIDIDINEYYQNTMIYQEICKRINRTLVDMIFHTKEKNLYKAFNNKDLKKIFSLRKPDISRYVKYKFSKKLLFMMPFLDYYCFVIEKGEYFYAPSVKETDDICSKLNYIRVLIKTFIRRNFKIINLENKLKEVRDSIKESGELSSNKQQFSNVPPRHILPFELESLKTTSDGVYLVKEKPDGCIVDFISKDVEPVISEYNSNVIKAEFIEDLDLYLIFDINIKDKGHLQRYKYLRSLHPHTRDLKNDTKLIETFEDLTSAIEEERKVFKQFLKKPYKNYRIYPKASWIVKSNDCEINKSIIDNIIGEKNYQFICEEGEYLNDGLVITPFDGSRELKVKPKSLMTIDILYKDKKWFDREGNDLTEIIDTKDSFHNNTIWRCYPTNDGKFLPKEYRFDKVKPNKSIVVDMIIKLIKIDWSSLGKFKNEYYYPDDINRINHRSDGWNNICKEQSNIIMGLLEKLEPELKAKWLDLGCGSSKLLNIIKKYTPKKYLGTDIDPVRILKAVKRIESNKDFSYYSEVVLSDLSKKWEDYEIAWSEFGKDKFNYIVCSFSLVHFYNEEFWLKIQEYSTNGTKFIFNLVNDNINSKWEDNGCYMLKSDNKVKYKFEIHEKEIEEQYIESDFIKKKLLENNWKLNEVYTHSGNSLSSKYSWYVAEYC